MAAIIIIVLIVTIILLSCAQNVWGCLALSPHVCKASQSSENSPKKIQTGKGLWRKGAILRGLAALWQLNAPSFAVLGAPSLIQAGLIKLLSSFQSLKSKRSLLAASTLRLKIAAH